MLTILSEPSADASVPQLDLTGKQCRAVEVQLQHLTSENNALQTQLGQSHVLMTGQEAQLQCRESDTTDMERQLQHLTSKKEALEIQLSQNHAHIAGQQAQLPDRDTFSASMKDDLDEQAEFIASLYT